jgi:hypothetical protein
MAKEHGRTGSSSILDEIDEATPPAVAVNQPKPKVLDQGTPEQDEISKALAGPATKSRGGRGLQGRSKVIVKGEKSPVMRSPRQGDDSRPQCPYCTTDDAAVLCGASSSPSSGDALTTRYRCPISGCTYSVQIMRPGADSIMNSKSGHAGQLDSPFVERQ